MNNNLSQNQFRYSTNMKDKPNSQGTLFGVDKSQRTPESRQPRGFSPQRYADVTKALDVKVENTRGKSWMGHEHGGTRMMVHNSHAEQLARSVNSVARSTVPLSDITKPHPDQPKSDDNPSLSMGIWNKTVDETGEQGHYNSPGSTAIKGEGRIAIMQGAGDDTPIHEIGHHVDRGHPYKTPEDQGRAEGFADAYAAKHTRTAGYKKKPVDIPSNPSPWHYHEGVGVGHGYKARQFDEGYRQNHPPIQPKQFDGLGDKTYPKGHIQGQLPLLHKTTTTGPMNWETGERQKGVAWRYADE